MIYWYLVTKLLHYLHFLTTSLLCYAAHIEAADAIQSLLQLPKAFLPFGFFLRAKGTLEFCKALVDSCSVSHRKGLPHIRS
jgi:hypothetical protein